MRVARSGRRGVRHGAGGSQRPHRRCSRARAHAYDGLPDLAADVTTPICHARIRNEAFPTQIPLLGIQRAMSLSTKCTTDRDLAFQFLVGNYLWRQNLRLLPEFGAGAV